MAASNDSEKTLRRAGRTHIQAIYLHPGSHAGYYPMKVLFDTTDGRILGAQIVGEADIAWRQ